MKYFNAIVDGNDVSNAKPDPEVFLIAAKLLGKNPEDSIVFSERQLKMPEPDIEFDLTAETYQTLMKALGVLQLPEVAIQGDSTGIFIATVNTKNPSSNNYRVQIGPANGHDFNLVFRSENLKIIVTDYRVKITQRGFAHFESDIVEYFVAMEQRSKYE